MERLELAVWRERRVELPAALWSAAAAIAEAVGSVRVSGVRLPRFGFGFTAGRQVVAIQLAVLAVLKRLATVSPADGQRTHLHRAGSLVAPFWVLLVSRHRL